MWGVRDGSEVTAVKMQSTTTLCKKVFNICRAEGKAAISPDRAMISQG